MTTAEKTRRAGRTRGVLSEREIQVARLVVSGMMNKEIAEKLVISKRTVDSHVEHIYAKLGVSTRAELVARIMGQPLPEVPVTAPPDPPLARRLRQFAERYDMTPMERALTQHVADIVRSVAFRQATSINGK